MNTKQQGDISEAHVLAAFLKAGLTVLLPFGDRNRYDMVVEYAGEFNRVQVKTGRLSGCSIKFNSYSTTTENGKVKHVHYKGQIDKFAVYVPATDKIYLVPVDACRERDTKLSLTGVSRNQHSPLLASKFEWPISSFGRAAS